MVPVYDVSQVKLQGDLARIVPVGRPVTVSINTQLAGDARLTAGVTCECIMCLIKDFYAVPRYHCDY